MRCLSRGHSVMKQRQLLLLQADHVLSVASYMIYGFARRYPLPLRGSPSQVSRIVRTTNPVSLNIGGPTLGTAMTEYLWWMRDWIYAG